MLINIMDIFSILKNNILKPTSFIKMHNNKVMLLLFIIDLRKFLLWKKIKTLDLILLQLENIFKKLNLPKQNLISSYRKSIKILIVIKKRIN